MEEKIKIKYVMEIKKLSTDGQEKQVFISKLLTHSYYLSVNTKKNKKYRIIKKKMTSDMTLISVYFYPNFFSPKERLKK